MPYDVEVCKQVRQGLGDGSATNEIIGAIFGGAIGNQFGDGDGKDAMTLAGMFLGASLAHATIVWNGTQLHHFINGKKHRINFMK